MFAIAIRDQVCAFNASTQGPHESVQCPVMFDIMFSDEKSAVNALPAASTQHWASQRDRAMDLCTDHLLNIFSIYTQRNFFCVCVCMTSVNDSK